MKKALITGSLGQDGSYLAEYLLSLGYEVWGTLRRIGNSLHDNTNTWIDNVNYIYADMTDELSLDKVIRKCWPDEIYNLAGQVFVPTSWSYPAQTYDVNVGGLARIFSVLDKVCCKAKVYQASSSEMYGNVLKHQHEVFLNEDTRMYPVSPYGASKYAAHKLIDVYRQKGYFAVSGILGNHESPRRGPEMVTRKITRHVAQWKMGGKDPLQLGNILSKRDWGFAGDYVKAMHSMLQQDEPSDYVIGTGFAHSVEDFLYAAIEAAGLDTVKYKKMVASSSTEFARKEDLQALVMDYSKAKRMLNWSPTVSFNELVSMMVNADVYALGGIECTVK